jgi:hypothetical protein
MQTIEEPSANETEFLPPVTDADAPEVPAREEFHINSEAAANWYLKKLANIEAEKARVTQQAALIVAQLESDAESLRYCFESELQNYVRRQLAATGSRRKSVHFLQGTACFRTVPAGIRISDSVAALNFCRVNLPGAVKTTETLDAGKYRDFAEKQAEAVPGVETTPAREAFRVTFGSK